MTMSSTIAPPSLDTTADPDLDPSPSSTDAPPTPKSNNPIPNLPIDTTVNNKSAVLPSPSSDAPKPIYPGFRSMLDIGDVQSSAPRRTKIKETPITPTQESFNQIQGSPTKQQDEPVSRESNGTPLTHAATAPDLVLLEKKAPQSQNASPAISRNVSDRNLFINRMSTNDSIGSPASARVPNSTTRGGFMKRMGSYLKPRKGKSPPRESGTPTEPSQNSRPGFAFTRSSTNSQSNTPPSPSSRESTIFRQNSDEVGSDYLDPQYADLTGHGHSASASNVRSPSPRIGITWGPNYTDEGQTVDEPPRIRRRSVSQDHLSFLRRAQPKRDTDEVGDLMATFSFRSAEGVGMKARRLSTHLPDQFYVPHIELEKEFKSSSHIPIRRGRTIGKGATATVKLMFKKGDNSHTYYAVKEFRKMDPGEDEIEYVKKVKSEFSIAASLKHPNIVDTVRLCTSHGRWNHVMEYCQFGEIYHWVEKGLFRYTFKDPDRLCFFKQLVRGIAYLHDHGIAHRDIKLENLLLTSDGVLKITDFGVSEVFSGQHPGLLAANGECGKDMDLSQIRLCTPGICGSLPYIAPEVMEKGKEYDPRPLDVWSCAIVYLTMTFGGSPWGQATDSDDRYARFKKGWDAFFEKNPDGAITPETGFPVLGPLFSADLLGTAALKKIMINMLHPMPAQRITIQEVMNSPYIRGIECCTPEHCDDNPTSPGTEHAKCAPRKFTKQILRKHSHIPPKEHKTPLFFQHRFDMGDGYR